MTRQKRGVTLGSACLLALLTAPLAAQVAGERPHDPDHVYQVRTALGITTLIDLGKGNEILDHATGFGRGWETHQREHLLYVKPLGIDVATNLSVRTASSTYLFELRVVSADWATLEEAKSAGVQYRVVVGPQETERVPDAAPPMAGLDQPSPSVLPHRAYHFAYAAKPRRRSDWLVPAHAYDDGRFTYLHIAPVAGMSGGFPSVLAREAVRSDDIVVNSSVQDRVIIVHGTYPYLVLRHGDSAVLLHRQASEAKP